MAKQTIYAGDMHRGCCALCKYWYDPNNSAIIPLPGNWWKYDTDMQARCMKKFSLKTKGRYSCQDFESKV